MTKNPAAPEPGRIARVRSRQYLIEDVVQPSRPGEQSLVRLSCLDDDAQGSRLEVLWEKEVDAEVMSDASWHRVAERGFDPPALFAAYLHTLRWNCVTATDPRLFQAPYRAGIEVMAYQLEPLRKALRLPRVNLFIADDVGLGKTIEAGLILRELLMRQKVRRVVIAAPASIVPQWREELESRFGLTFAVFDRAYLLRTRRERGYGVNPWTTHTRFIVSHSLLSDETYAGTLRDWLGDASPGSLLVLDEAHHAAPASGSKYAIDSMFTRIIRDLAHRFEHRLFLSATPHNGHSNSFAALLEILDPQRFCRGVAVKSAGQLEPVLVRRLKPDLRETVGDFPRRRVVQIDIDGLPAQAPELLLPALLDRYANRRAERLAEAKRSVQVAAALLTTSLQKRLFSSIEAFACTLRVHRRTVERQADAEQVAEGVEQRRFDLLREAPGADDDRAELDEEEVQVEDEAQIEAATRLGGTIPPDERELLDEMTRVAESGRGAPDARVQRLAEWIREHMCPDLPGFDADPLQTPSRWNDRRLLIFTEYADTKRYLAQQLHALVALTDGGESRIATFHGGMGETNREEVKRAFNADPSRHPLRILIATDAAREGINLQNHCADLIHFDVPWNPARMEQRNGRIDRKLQRAKEVRCHYFWHAQRPEDYVLQVLVRKTERIQQELGSLSPVLERRLERLLEDGIRRDSTTALVRAIDCEALDTEVQGVVEEELESVRQRREALDHQLQELQDLLAKSREHLGLGEETFRDALSRALELLGAEPLRPVDGANDPTSSRWTFPALDRRPGADPTWADTLDTLRPPRRRDQRLWEWRRAAEPRPVVFSDPGNIDEEVVHLHLEHRVAQRLLGRFLAQGFAHHDLSRACIGQSRDPVPRVLLLGRLSLYGAGASRLHDEILAVAARWTEPRSRREPLRPYGEEAERKALALLEEALATSGQGVVAPRVEEHLRATVERDVSELLPHLNAEAEQIAARAAESLARRGAAEAEEMKKILLAQRTRIERTLADTEGPQKRFDFADEEARQLESDRRHWQRRLDALASELEQEPERIRAIYAVRARRIEPVGLVYLWPVSG